MSARKKQILPNVDPDFLEKQKAALVRTHRQVLYFNEKEMNAIEEYCRRFKVRSRSSMLRQAIIERVLSDLDENHPTLF
ncbi:MAG: hypothetical protein IJ654_08025 [Bacteroidales bacterium]|nr:hypothetical protein [Bacteroidales bacterium]